MSRLRVSIITSIVLILSSFIPVLQIVLLYLNSIIIMPIGLFLGVNDKIWMYGVNTTISLLMFFLFYFSSSNMYKFFSIVGVLLFFIPLMAYSTAEIINTNKFYFLQFLVIGIVTSVILIGVEFLQSKAIQ